MSRRKIIAGNWKMNLSLTQARQLIADVRDQASDYECEVMIFPSFVYLTDAVNLLKESEVKVGAQNCSEKESGAYTGEVSAAMLSSVGVEYVIIGHSERRELFGETNEVLKEKLKVALRHPLKVVFCCGEPLSIRQANQQEEYVSKQLEESLFALSDEDMLQVVIAYEPVWAIGTGLNATPDQAQQMHAFIRNKLSEKFGKSIAAQTRILYGGSCKPENAASLFDCADVDGGLIGGASLQAKDFISMIQSV